MHISRWTKATYKRQEVISPKGTKITKQVQINSTANMLRSTNDSNHYLYEGNTRVIAEERTVVTKLNKLAANRPDESKVIAKLSKQEGKNQTELTYLYGRTSE